MRTFGGDLGILGLGNLFQVISMSAARGFLTISQGDIKKTIQFASTGIRLASGVRRALPLGQILIRMGRLTQAQLDELLAEQRQTQQRIGDLLIERGYLTKEQIDQALRDQVSEEIYELFAWAEGRFYFAEADNDNVPNGSGPLATVTLDSNIISLMVEAARRADEMKLIRNEIPMDQLIPQRSSTAVEAGTGSQESREILALVDGQRSIELIVQFSSYPKFTVLHNLFELKQAGMVIMNADSAATPAAPAGPTVLLIAKEETARTEMTEQLKDGGWSVVQAPGWTEAENWVSPAAAVIVDLAPDVNEGLAICDRLRDEMKKNFIVVTEAASQMEALQSGARYVLLKPVPAQVLLDRTAQLRGN